MAIAIDREHSNLCVESVHDSIRTSLFASAGALYALAAGFHPAAGTFMGAGAYLGGRIVYLLSTNLGLPENSVLVKALRIFAVGAAIVAGGAFLPYAFGYVITIKTVLPLIQLIFVLFAVLIRIALA